jgi:hypothetical protein
MEIQGIIDKLVAAGAILIVALVSPLVLIALDFWAGVRKAKERHEAISSDGWQRTVSKIGKYYNALLAMLVIDTLQMSLLWYLDIYHRHDFPVLPFLTFLGAVFIGAIEVKSIYERADDKTKKQAKQVADTAAGIVRNRTDAEKIAKIVIDYLNEKTEEKEDKNEQRAE